MKSIYPLIRPLIVIDVGKYTNIGSEQNGKDIWLYGASLIKAFIQLNLIDIYRISLHPIVLGNGKPLFEDLKERIKLHLIKSNTFKSGVVQLIYENK